MTAFFQNLGLPYEGAWTLATLIGILVIALPLMLAIPMCLLYELGIMASRAVAPKSA